LRVQQELQDDARQAAAAAGESRADELRPERHEGSP
jgi:hypothetical protein